jgi:hypothetical protein
MAAGAGRALELAAQLGARAPEKAAATDEYAARGIFAQLEAAHSAAERARVAETRLEALRAHARECDLAGAEAVAAATRGAAELASHLEAVTAARERVRAALQTPHGGSALSVAPERQGELLAVLEAAAREAAREAENWQALAWAEGAPAQLAEARAAGAEVRAAVARQGRFAGALLRVRGAMAQRAAASGVA